MTSPPSSADFDLVTVQSGDRSLRSRACGETFHPVIGPMGEAEVLHVRQQRLAERAAALGGALVIWDVGLGAAANAIAAIESLRHGAAKAALHSFERDPGALVFALRHAAELPYLAPHAKSIGMLLSRGRTAIGPVEWVLHEGDFRSLLQTERFPAPHAILFDPYSPSSNPELWSLEAFQELCRSLSPETPTLWTNYTRSTAIRVALLLAGFYVGHGWAIAEKEQTTVASNTPSLLEAPLDSAWLNRVRRSTRSAPPRDGDRAGGPISEEDWQALLRHPQFQGLPPAG